MSASLVLLFEIIGTVAFALSGAMVGIQKKMDILGIIILGTTTAVGGGVIRDLILGHTPPATFRNPIYALVAVCVSIVVFFPSVRRLLEKKQRIYDIVMLLMDSVGLGIFTVVGIQIANAASDSYSAFLLLFVGVITGVGGGVMRDVMAGNTPYIFVKHFYATASLIGAAVCILLWRIIGDTAAMLIGAAAVIVLRLLAAHFHWELPKA